MPPGARECWSQVPLRDPGASGLSFLGNNHGLPWVMFPRTWKPPGFDFQLLGLPGVEKATFIGSLSISCQAPLRTRLEDPRWWLEGGSRQHDLCKSEIFLRHWSHTWQKKTTKNKQNSDTPNPQPNKASSCHITLRKQEASRTTRCQLQTHLGDADQQVSK
jgi:hypothetical protein